MPSAPFTRSSQAALNLVEHQQKPSFITDRAEAFEKFRTRDMDAPLALDRLDKDRCRTSIHSGADGIEISKWQMAEPLQQRAKPFLHFVLPGRGNAGHRTSVEGALEGENTMPACLTSEPAGDLDEPLIGFGSAVAEKNLSRARDLDKALGQGNLGLCSIEVGGVNQLRRLRAHCRRDFRMGMAQRANGNASTEIEVFRSVGPPYPTP